MNPEIGSTRQLSIAQEKEIASLQLRVFLTKFTSSCRGGGVEPSIMCLIRTF